MSNEELHEPTNPPTKSRSLDWVWPTIAGVVITRLFGIAGCIVFFGAYYWLKPKFGAWLAVAISSVAGICFALALVALLESSASTPIKTIPNSEIPQASKATPSVAPEEPQRALLVAANEIIARYPQLDPDSPFVDRSAIDYVVAKRDAYAANGHAIDIALRMAANDYGEQLVASQQQEATKRYEQQTTSQRFSQPSVSQAQPLTNDYIRRKREPCQPKDVMTDEEIARCRGR